MPAKGLGRGFDSLIPTQVLDESFDPTINQDEQVSELRKISLSEITPDPNQPRRHFDEEALAELTASIKEHGVLQPIVVTPVADGYQVVAGERRFRASKAAGLTKIPAIVRTLSNQHKLELALIENIQRRDLNPLETATAYLKLHQQFSLTYEEIGKRVGGKAISTISNALRLLQLPDAAKEALVTGTISEGHARQILALDKTTAQLELLRLITVEGWSVRKAEQYVVGYKQGEQAKPARVAARAKTQTETPHTKALAKRLSADVKVKNTAKGGQLVIRFKDDSDFERIADMLLQ
ncbi:chromosome partitioning protein ParB [Candidatus Saccharibacteria bacterium]|nr:MAG: chromosome partitioning protein ParB [Candidatus Saccharibacteria bacterium]